MTRTKSITHSTESHSIIYKTDEINTKKWFSIIKWEGIHFWPRYWNMSPVNRKNATIRATNCSKLILKIIILLLFWERYFFFGDFIENMWQLFNYSRNITSRLAAHVSHLTICINMAYIVYEDQQFFSWYVYMVLPLIFSSGEKNIKTHPKVLYKLLCGISDNPYSHSSE